MKDIELAIIGAGPAGLSASLEAAKSGVKVVLIDENMRPGGQIYRQPSENFILNNKNPTSKEGIRGKKLLRELYRYSREIEFFKNAEVWGLFKDKEVAFAHEGENKNLKAKKLILSEGKRK